MQVKLLGSGKIMRIVFVFISLYDLILVSTISSASYHDTDISGKISSFHFSLILLESFIHLI